MGATPSSTRQKEFAAEITRWPGLAEKACLTSSDVSGIAAAFWKANEGSEADGLLRVDFEHWLEFGDKPKPVESRLFDVFLVTQGAEQISLYDFVVSLVNYCVDSKENLSRLAFDIYDRHTTGTITEADLEGMLIDVWGPNWEGEELAKNLLAERAGLDAMKPDEWEAFCREYPNLLHPIYKLKRTLQECTLGHKRWVKIHDRIKKARLKREAEHARRMRSVPDEDRENMLRAIRVEEASAHILSGTRGQRIVAMAEQAADVGGNGDLLPGIAVKAGGKGTHLGPSVTTAMKAMEVRERLDAARNRSVARGGIGGNNPIDWGENPLNRKKSNSVQEEEIPKFSMTSRKVRVGDLEDDGDNMLSSDARFAMTPGSNGTARSPLGSPSSNSQRQGPSLADAGKDDESAAGGDHRGSVGTGARIGGGYGYSGSTLGSPSSGPRLSDRSDAGSSSRVERPNSGELRRKPSSAAMVARKQSTALGATTGSSSLRKTSMAAANLSRTQRPSVGAKSGRKPSVAQGGAAKRSSVATIREGKRDLLENYRKASQQGAGSGGRKPSRAVVAAGS